MSDHTTDIFYGEIIKILQLPPVPNQLYIIEFNSKEIIDNIQKGDWDNVNNNLNFILSNMKELIPFLNEASVLAGLIIKMNLQINYLEQYIMEQDAKGASSQANLITLYVAEMLDYFNVIVPTDINRLKYLGRQILIAVDNLDWDDINISLIELKEIWARLKPELSLEFNDDLNEFEFAVKNLEDAINQKNKEDTINNSNIILNLLDVLENDFIQQNTTLNT